MILFFTLEWFYNHPALRYGGNISVAVISIYSNFNLFIKIYLQLNKLKKKLIFLFLLTSFIYIVKNYNRILFEVEKYNFEPLTKPYFYINSDGFKVSARIQNIKNKFYSLK